MSGVLAPIGIVSGPMAEQFDLELTAMTSRFSWLTLGLLVGAGFAVPLLQYVRLRRVVLGVYGLMSCALFAFGWPKSIFALQLLLGVVGVCSGVGLAAAASVISRAYDDSARASALVITDGFFSIAGFICAGFATYLVQAALPWSFAYVFVGLVGTLVVGLAAVSEFPELAEANPQAVSRWRPWPSSAWYCIGALGLYTLAQSCILLWLPQFAQQTYGFAPGAAGALVGQFWLGMFFGQIAVALVVLWLGIRLMLWLAVSGTLLGSVAIAWIGSPDWLWFVVLLWGFANLGLLKLVIALAAQLTVTPSPALLSSLLFGATLGTALGPVISSQLVGWGGVARSLQFASALYLMMFVLLAIAMRILAQRDSNLAR